MTLGQAISAARKAKKITQVELARRLGITQGGVSDLERSGTEISVARLLAVCREIGVPAWKLLKKLED